MVVKRQCSFCAAEIEPGTGTVFVRRDGTVYHFCSSSCRKQQLHLHRVGHRLKWTRAHGLKRAADRSVGAARTAPAPPPSEAPPAPAAGAKSRRARAPAKAPPAEAPSASKPEAPAAAGEPSPAEASAKTAKPRAPRKKPPVTSEKSDA